MAASPRLIYIGASAPQKSPSKATGFALMGDSERKNDVAQRRTGMKKRWGLSNWFSYLMIDHLKQGFPKS